MAGARVTMDTRVLKNLVGDMLQKVQERQNLMENIGETIVSSVLQRFEEGKGPDGAAWEVSGRAWSDGLKKDGKFGQTLVDTGRLKGSMVYEASPDMVVVGSNVEYSAIHQFGGMAGRGRKVKIPARPFLGINDEDKKEIKHMIEKYLQG